MSGGDGHQVPVGRPVYCPRFGKARVALQPAVQMRGSYIEQQLGAGARPAHLSLLAHTLVDQLVHGRFHMGSRQALPLRVDNPWFAGEAAIPTFSREEMLATKLRALLQRDKGRDLYDLSHALDVFDELDVDRVTDLFGRYLRFADQSISRAQAEERMFAKLANPRLLTDMRPLLPLAQAELLSDDATIEAFERVFEGLVTRIAGDAWVRTGEMKERFGLSGQSSPTVP